MFYILHIVYYDKYMCINIGNLIMNHIKIPTNPDPEAIR